MHGELIYSESAAGREWRLAGNAVVIDDHSLRWEFHDRQLSDSDLHDVLEALSRARGSGEEVMLNFLDSGPPLDEVESGPLAETDEAGPVRYQVEEIDDASGRVTLRRAG